eukprot:Rmarinus@m.16993
MPRRSSLDPGSRPPAPEHDAEIYGDFGKPMISSDAMGTSDKRPDSAPSTRPSIGHYRPESAGSGFSVNTQSSRPGRTHAKTNRRTRPLSSGAVSRSSIRSRPFSGSRPRLQSRPSTGCSSISRGTGIKTGRSDGMSFVEEADLGDVIIVPSDVEDMAFYLGIDVANEADLMWIAKQAILAPLPARWEELEDENGEYYYYNLVTGTTTRKHPNDDKYSFMVKLERKNKHRLGVLSQFSPWMDFRDESGQPYFHNFVTNESTFHRPDDANLQTARTIRRVFRVRQAAVEDAAATAIQAHVKGMLVRRLFRKLRAQRFCIRFCAAFKVQRWWKRLLACRILAKSCNKTLVVAYFQFWLDVANSREGFVRFLLQRKMAIKIQAAWRGYWCRKLHEKPVCQVFTRNIPKEKRFIDLEERRSVYYENQMNSKGFVRRRRFTWLRWKISAFRSPEFVEKVKRIRAARRIQRFVRYRLVVIQCRRVEHRIRLRRAVIGVQRLWRNRVARQWEYRWGCARKIRRRMLVFVQKRREHRSLCAVRIQRWWRRVLSRRKRSENRAAFGIQVAWRGFQFKERVRHRKAVVRIQRWWRRHRREVKYAHSRAAIKIQAVWKGFRLRSKGRDFLIKLARRYGATGRVELSQHTALSAVLVMQRAWRESRARVAASAERRARLRELKKQKEVEQRAQREYRAAVTIQSLFRGYMARSEFEHMLAAHRDRLARQAEEAALAEAEAEAAAAVAEEEYFSDSTDSEAASYRSSIRSASTASEIVEQRMESAAVLIQSRIRGFLARRRLHRQKQQSDWEKQRAAAIRIQAAFRGNVVRRWLERRRRWRRKGIRARHHFDGAWMDTASEPCKWDFETNMGGMYGAAWKYSSPSLNEEGDQRARQLYQERKEMRNARYRSVQTKLLKDFQERESGISAAVRCRQKRREQVSTNPTWKHVKKVYGNGRADMNAMEYAVEMSHSPNKRLALSSTLDLMSSLHSPPPHRSKAKGKLASGSGSASPDDYDSTIATYEEDDVRGVRRKTSLPGRRHSLPQRSPLRAHTSQGFAARGDRKAAAKMPPLRARHVFVSPMSSSSPTSPSFPVPDSAVAPLPTNPYHPESHSEDVPVPTSPGLGSVSNIRIREGLPQLRVDRTSLSPSEVRLPAPPGHTQSLSITSHAGSVPHMPTLAERERERELGLDSPAGSDYSNHLNSSYEQSMRLNVPNG